VIGLVIGGSLALLVAVLAGILVTLRRLRAEQAGQWRPAHRIGAGRFADAAVEAGQAEQRPPAKQEIVTAVISAGPVDRTVSPDGPIALEWTESDVKQD